MRFWIATLLALVLLAGVWLWRGTSSVTSPPSATHGGEQSAARSTSPLIEGPGPALIHSSASRFRPAAPRESAAPAHAKPPTGSQVEFEIIGEYAVAWGDVLLGKVAADFPRGRGIYDAPTPRLWESPVIPYVISSDLPDPARVQRAIAYFNQHTVVRFVPYEGQSDAIVFEPGDEHCYSGLGKTGGLQPIRLASACGAPEILHEILHALGFLHEHSRPDRDQFVQVHWERIDPKYHSQFALAPESLAEPMRDTPFDYRSILLYRPDTFALHPGGPTLTPVAGAPAIEPMDELSPGDVARLRRLFRM